MPTPTPSPVLPGKGTGRSARTSLVATLLLALIGLALVSSSALASVTHKYLLEPSTQLRKDVPAEGPHGETISVPGLLNLSGSSMTIDSGDLWLAEEAFVNGEGYGVFRLDEYDDATGVFLGQHDHSVANFVTFGEYGIAIGHAAGKTQTYLGERLGLSNAESAVAVLTESGAEKIWTGAATPAGSFGAGAEGVTDVAVDNSTSPLDEHKGDLYVAVPEQDVIDIFHPEADGDEHYVGQITGISATEPFERLGKIAVSDLNGDVVVKDGPAVDILEPAAFGEYTLVERIVGTPTGPFASTYNLTVDGASGEIYVTESVPGSPTVIDQFSSTGAFLGRINGKETPARELEDVYSIAVDPESHQIYVADAGARRLDVFGPDLVIPDVTVTEPVSNLTPTGVTLKGTVNPDGAGEATCEFEYGTTSSYGQQASCSETVAEGHAAVSVTSLPITGLRPDTTYRYRLDATNVADGLTGTGEGSTDLGEFTTPGPGLDEISVADVSASSATFLAAVNPHGNPTSAFIEYGTSTTYGTDVPATPGSSLGEVEGDVNVPPQHIQGLSASTVYHYRLVAVSDLGSGPEQFDGPDETFTTQALSGETTLPDGRQWELVTPPNKLGASIGGLAGELGVIQAADNGTALSYLANAPTEAGAAANDASSVQLLSRRGPEGWSTRDIPLPHERAAASLPGTAPEYRFFSEGLSSAIIQPLGQFNASISPEASEQTPYMRTLGACESNCVHPLVTGKAGFENVPLGTTFGETSSCEKGAVVCGPQFLGASPDASHVVLSSKTGLTSGAPSEELYEWTAGKLTLISVLPPNEKGEELPVPTGSEGLNPRLGSDEGPDSGGGRWQISADGSRVFFEADSELYMRDLVKHQTLEIDLAEAACLEDPEGHCASGGGRFQVASSDGSRVYFTGPKLTKDAGEGANLYECEIVETAGRLACDLSDITPMSAGGESAEQLGGVLGASEDGSTVYFVADGVIEDAPGARPGDCTNFELQSSESTCNLYVHRVGEPTQLVAVLSSGDNHVWATRQQNQPARVSPNGEWVTFMSQRSLTGYENRDAVSGQPDAEIYLYNADSGRLVCTSCEPSGARPTGVEYNNLEGGELLETLPHVRGEWPGNGWVAALLPRAEVFNGSTSAYQPRYLSNSGRLFFNSADALVPEDVNGIGDVYEYEPPSVGRCANTSTTYVESYGGCIALISSGTSPRVSTFVDASASGGDVFFSTSSRLTSSDIDDNEDIYDAHECTSESPCIPAPATQPPACITEGSCKQSPSPQPPIFGAPASATFSGAGNVTPPSVQSKPKTAAQLKAEKLSEALKACKRDRKKHKRLACEKQARQRYGAKAKNSAHKTNRRAQ
jgi:hypothetical protein